MTRTLYQRSIILLGILLVLGTFSVAAASDRYEYNRNDYEYRYTDNSIDHSFNNYDSFNYTYGYPYSNVAYSYPSHSSNYYSGDYYYNDYADRSYSHRPTCSVSTYRTNGNSRYDNSVTVTWWSSGATNAYLTGFGSVSLSGTQMVSGYQQSTYTLTVSGPGGTTSCSATSPFYDAGTNHRYTNTHGVNYITNPSFAYPVYSYPYTAGTVYTAAPTTYVTLTQVPYTGFDFGTFGNSLYWLAMILVAMMGAYFIVYSHSGMMPRAFVREVGAAARNQARLVKSLIK